MRIVKRACDRKIKIDQAVPILQERDCKSYRQLRCRGTLDRAAKCELVEHDPVLGVERAFLDEIGEVQRQLALLDRVTSVFTEIWRERTQFDVLEIDLDVYEQVAAQRINLTRNLQGRAVLQFPA